MTVAPVCHVGDPVQITCTASVTEMDWSFKVINQQGENEPVTGFSRAGALSNQSMLIEVNYTTFALIRNSSQNVLPLIVTLSIDSVSIGLNGTVVTCRDAGNSMITVSTAIQIIDISNSER